MLRGWLGLSIALALPVAGYAQTPAAPAAPPVDNNAAALLADTMTMFDALCLQKFPDDAAVDVAVGTAASGHAAVPIPAAEIKDYLHGDPGHGWRIDTPQGRYVVTIEAPPFHACAVRRMTPAGVADTSSFPVAVAAFAAAKGLQTTPMQRVQFPNRGGIDIVAYGINGTDSAGTVNAFFLFVSDYHGNPPAEFRTDARGGTGVEIRLVRQFPPTAPAKNTERRSASAASNAE